jgi:DNA-binding CsgD family transcriptional regulator
MTTGELYAADVEALVRVLDDARHDDPGPAMPWALLEGLQRLIPCDLEVVYEELDHQRCQTVLAQCVGEDGAHFGPEPTAPDPADEAFWGLWWHNLCSFPQRIGDLSVVVNSADFYPTDRDWLADPLSEVLPEARHSISVHLPAVPGHARRVLFFRQGGPAFGERDRQLLVLLRPHLQEIWVGAERRRSGVPQLTAREWEVLALAATGMPYAQMAGQLFISVGTVRKHMEHVRDRLGVHSIPAAAATAMPHAPAHLRVRSTAGCPPASPAGGTTGGR